jgi:hypothetical protein
MRCQTAAALVSAVFLAGCNMVMTEKPMFTAADGAGAAPIRSGVWRTDTTGCDVDETLTQDKWPKCANPSPGVAEPPFWLQVAGQPALLQMPLPLPKAGVMTVFYVYAAYRPLKLDAQGRVIALKTWLVQCGPPPKPAAPVVLAAGASAPAAPTHQLMGMTDAPLPGLKMTNHLGGCTTDSAAAVRNAAAASEAWVGDNPISHWVRDPKPGDLPLLTPAALTEALKPPR